MCLRCAEKPVDRDPCGSAASAPVGRRWPGDWQGVFAAPRQKEICDYRPRQTAVCGLFFGDDGHQRAVCPPRLAVLPALWPLALPLVVALSGLLAWPIEKAISECYFRDARRKLLANPRLVRIGITGSYGKTSVKHILGAILSEKYPTLITPASFNTPMGVTRATGRSSRPPIRCLWGKWARGMWGTSRRCAGWYIPPSASLPRWDRSTWKPSKPLNALHPPSMS